MKGTNHEKKHNLCKLSLAVVPTTVRTFLNVTLAQDILLQRDQIRK
jgi:hypothetical protein